MSQQTRRSQGLFSVLLGDGRPLIAAAGSALIFSGGFAIFLGATGQFLPQDRAFLGMSADDLCAIADCSIVDFMIHDRVAWGGALIAVGILYLWLVAFPLARQEPWAWWLAATTGLVGFASFLTYMGYGYLDTWHGVGTLLLFPVFAEGLRRTWTQLQGDRSPRWMLHRTIGEHTPGRWLIEATAFGLFVGGLVITFVGVTDIFVPQDLSYMNLDRAALDEINPRLVPLMAHDRAGFGGANATLGLFALVAVRCEGLTRSLWEAIAIAGVALIASAIGIHYIIGYTDIVHLAPAWLGGATLTAGLALAAPRALRGSTGTSA